jgi:adenylate cyclase
MCFRIGITVGDVVERAGDLLGDGVNIAARLQGIAPVGGICVSRTVHEQVANKLSVHFAEIGEQQVKNIPNPIHAFNVEMRSADARTEVLPAKKRQTPAWIVPAAIAVICVALLGIAAFAYLTIARQAGAQVASQPVPTSAAPSASATPLAPLAAAPPSTPTRGRPRQWCRKRSRSFSIARVPPFATPICLRPITRRSRSAPLQ